MIAVVNSGYPMDIRRAEKYDVDALVWCGFSGMSGGRALVDVLTGKVNPSGKLPDTWSNDYWDIPAAKNFCHAGGAGAQCQPAGDDGFHLPCRRRPVP